MDIITAVTLFCLAVATVFLALWMFYDRRDYALFEHARRKSTFCCVRCHHLYGVPGEPDVWKCPKCGHENSKLRF
ncbi:MAG TPA: hydrogenase nickel incorporation protein HypA [Opitutaceae bacterium]|nr:hydrogenase nickel incorporation protein HypA [Opitutaceae bacterium]